MRARLFYNAAAVVTPLDPGRPLAGKDQGRVRLIRHAALLERGGKIEAVGPEPDVLEHGAAIAPDLLERIDLGGGCVVPGFVDPHTHMCFAQRREGEFGMRLGGATYLDILASGGGILSSVRAVRETSSEELLARTLGLIRSATRHGTTTVEIKSGYGLDTATELRMLEVIAQAGRESEADVVPTFMGAHAVPPEYKQNPEAFCDIIINEMLPAVARQGHALFCDVFCETGVFSVDQSRRILEAALALGLGLKIHADEVNDLGGAGLAAELGTVSAEHLLAASDENIARMARAGVVAVLLPGTAYSLRKPYARCRSMIEQNVPVALATDCNPGSCFCESMPFVMGLAVMNMGMSPEEALVAATLNAAYAIGRERDCGSLEPGKDADFLVLDGEGPAVIAYHAGANPVAKVFKRGKLLADNA